MASNEHDWDVIFRGSVVGELATCTRCGLFRISTLSAVIYAVKWGEPFLQCNGQSAQTTARKRASRPRAGKKSQFRRIRGDDLLCPQRPLME